MTRDYRKIVAWQLAHELTLRVYRATKRFPSNERYGITSQIRRAAFSVPSNIAEGSGRDGNRDFLRFLHIALASLKEAEYVLLLARDLELLGDDEFKQMTESTNRTFATLHGFMQAVKKQAGVLE